MAIVPILTTNTPNEGRVIINDNFIELEGSINELNPDGIAWVFQAGPPDSADGFDGDMYFDTTNGIFYGPKAAGAWPAEGVEAGGGGDAIWNPVRAATTANITLSGAQTIDGVSCVAGDRVLVISQSTATQNGIYVVAAGAWSRATDANATADFLYGKLVFIGNEGDYNFNQIGVFNSFAPFTLGTDAVNFILAIAPATETQWGTARAATQTEVDAGDATGTDYYVRPETLAAYSGIPKDSKDSVRVATTANITLSGAQTIDGISVVAGNRVLVKNQTTGSQNGIYLCASGAWTRTTDADASTKVTPQMVVRVEEGTVNGSKQFYLSNTGAITLGTTVLTFALASGYKTLVTLGSDVTGSATANVFTDVTGLSFPVVAGTTYRFEALVWFDAPATTTGSKWAINGPASPTRLAYTATWPSSTTGSSTTHGNAYDLGTSSSDSAFTSGNLAQIQGIITPSASGTVVIRFASELGSSAIVAKAGSTLEWF